MFDDFDLFETCEEYYNDLEEWETQQCFLDQQAEYDEARDRWEEELAFEHFIEEQLAKIEADPLMMEKLGY